MAVMTQEPEWATRYPDLFDGLTEQQKWDVHNNIANHVMEGWQPDRDDVADLTALARGEIDGDECVRRGMARIEQRFTQA
jgi:hypothetical protein